MQSLGSVSSRNRYLRKKGQNRQAKRASSLGHAKWSKRQPEMETQSFKSNMSAISLSMRNRIRPAATPVIKVLAPETAKAHLVTVCDDCVWRVYQLEPVPQTPITEIAIFPSIQFKGGIKAAYPLVNFFAKPGYSMGKKLARSNRD